MNFRTRFDLKICGGAWIFSCRERDGVLSEAGKKRAEAQCANWNRAEQGRVGDSIGG